MSSTKPYEFLDHTADAKFLAHGITIEDAFANAARAMASVVADAHTLRGDMHKDVAVEGTDEKQLLYNFLEEILFLLDAHSYVVKDVSKIRINPVSDPAKGRIWKLTATLSGQTIDEKTPTHEHVKAVTYNEMEIRKEPGKVTVQVVLDL